MSGQEWAGETAPRGEGGAGWVPPDSGPEAAPAAAAGVAGSSATAVDPAPRRRGRKPVLAALAVVVVAALVGIGILLVGQGDEQGDGTGDEAATGDGADGEEPDEASVTTEAPTTTTAPEPEWQTVTGVDGEFRIELPGDWTYAALDDDPTGVGAKLFPDDPDNQALADGVAEIIASTGPRLVAGDREFSSDVMLPPFVGLERQPIDASLDLHMQTFLDAYADLGVVDPPQGRLTGASGEIGWVANPAVGRVDYLYASHGQTWKLAYVTAADNLAGERAVADHIAQSLVVTDAGTA